MIESNYVNHDAQLEIGVDWRLCNFFGGGGFQVDK